MSEKEKVQDYIINQKMMEKDHEIGDLLQKDIMKSEAIANLSDRLNKIDRKDRNA